MPSLFVTLALVPAVVIIIRNLLLRVLRMTPLPCGGVALQRVPGCK